MDNIWKLPHKFIFTCYFFFSNLRFCSMSCFSMRAISYIIFFYSRDSSAIDHFLLLSNYIILYITVETARASFLRQLESPRNKSDHLQFFLSIRGALEMTIRGAFRNHHTGRSIRTERSSIRGARSIRGAPPHSTAGSQICLRSFCQT